MTDNLLEVIHEVSREKGLDEETITKVVADSMVQAAQRKLPYLTVEGRIHPKTGKIELFNLASDPSEKNDLSATRERIAGELLGRLRSWRKKLGAKTAAGK